MKMCKCSFDKQFFVSTFEARKKYHEKAQRQFSSIARFENPFWHWNAVNVIAINLCNCQKQKDQISNLKDFETQN